MSNVMLAYPNRAGDATYSGGVWSANLPVSYLATRQLSQVARSASAATSGTWFYAAGAASIEAGVLALCNHNFSTAAQVRWRGFSTNPTSSFSIDFMNGNMAPAGWTCTRSSVTQPWHLNASGVLAQTTDNTPRPAYDASGTLLGLLVEGATTNHCLQARTPSSASWTKTNISVGSTATGPDGVANSATTISATAANSQLLQSIGTLSGSQCVFSVWMKRISGSGTIQISINPGVWVTCTLTTNWQRFQVAGAPASPTANILIATASDSIAVDFMQVEPGYYATTNIVTTTASAARPAEYFTYTPGATEIPLTTGTLSCTVVQIAPNMSSANTLVNVATAGNANAASLQTAYGSGNNNSIFNYAANSVTQASVSSAGVWTVGSVTRAVGSWAANSVGYNVNGTAGTTDTVATMASAGTYATTVQIGAAFAQYGGCAVQRIEVMPVALGASDLNSKATGGEITAAYDSGLFDAWPAAWVSGTTSEQRTGIRGITIHRPATAQTYQWWRCDISDASNSAGYVQLGRVFVGSAWSPTLNATYGADISYSARSSAVETHGGAEYFVDRPQPRTAAFTFPALTDAEGLGGLLELQRQVGTTREVLFSWNTADTLQMPRRTFLARLSKLSPLRAAAYGLNEAALEVKELL